MKKANSLEAYYNEEAAKILDEAGIDWDPEDKQEDFRRALQWALEKCCQDPFLDFSNVKSYKHRKSETYKEIQDAVLKFLQHEGTKASRIITQPWSEIETIILKSQLLPSRFEGQTPNEISRDINAPFNALLEKAKSSPIAHKALKEVIGAWVETGAVPKAICYDAADVITGEWEPEKKQGRRDQKTTGRYQKEIQVIYLIEKLHITFPKLFRKTKYALDTSSVFEFVADCFTQADGLEMTTDSIEKIYNSLHSKEKREILSSYEVRKAHQDRLAGKIRLLDPTL